MQIALYYAPIACSLVPYVALTEADAEFDVSIVDFLKGEHMSAEYLRLNPKHKVPLLVVDGEVLIENVAILQWISRNFQAVNLLPAGLNEFRAILLMSWCASGIHPFLTPTFSGVSARQASSRLMSPHVRIATHTSTACRNVRVSGS